MSAAQRPAGARRASAQRATSARRPASTPQGTADDAQDGASDAQSAVDIWTDGACKGNPGPGGWGALLRFGAREKELFGGEPATTNNRMELTAVIEALRALNRPCQVVAHVDSTYVMNGVTRWMAGWKRNGWKTAARQPVANQDLWQSLDAELAHHQVRWVWVKGHAGDPSNERADALANQGVPA